MAMLIIKPLAVSILAITLLSACDDRTSDAEQKMQEIRNQPAQPIEPLPQPQKIEDFVYSAGNIRSPFLAMSLISMQAQASQEVGVQPDLTRPKEPLEDYELSELVYRGKVVAPNGKEHGLVQLPNGFVRDVQVGEYMGKNHGKILEITSTQINLEEIIPDARGAYAYKRESLKTPD